MYILWLSSNIRAVALKLSETLKKQTCYQVSFYKGRQPFELEVQFLLKCDQLQVRGGAYIHPKRLQTQSAPVGGR